MDRTPKALSGFWGAVHVTVQSAGEAGGRVEKNSMKRSYQSGVSDQEMYHFLSYFDTKNLAPRRGPPRRR